MSTQDQDRATWTATLVIALTERMTDASRIKLLNAAYDIARNHGINDGIDRLAAGLNIHTIQRQAI